MDAGPDLGLGILRSHGAAPDLGVVEEEQLVVRHVEARQVRLGAVQGNPLLVGAVGLNRGKSLLIIFTTSHLSSPLTALANIQNCNYIFN